MIIIPAIDILGGNAVRLYKGDYNNVKIYSDDPVSLAENFEKMGADFLHIIDLDGAKEGTSKNFEVIKNIVKNTALKIQVGGGIRDFETIEKYLRIEVDRVLLGTKAFDDIGFLEKAIGNFGAEKIVLSADMKNGKVAKSGWEEEGENYFDFLKKLNATKLKYILATDTSKDGTLKGPNFELYKKIGETCPSLKIIVSGGISSEADIIASKDYYGVIVGKAFYEGRVDLAKIFNNVSCN